MILQKKNCDHQSTKVKVLKISQAEALVSPLVGSEIKKGRYQISFIMMLFFSWSDNTLVEFQLLTKTPIAPLAVQPLSSKHSGSSHPVNVHVHIVQLFRNRWLRESILRVQVCSPVPSTDNSFRIVVSSNLLTSLSLHMISCPWPEWVEFVENKFLHCLCISSLLR